MSDLYIHIPNELFAPGAHKDYSGKYLKDKISGNVDQFTILEPIKYNVSITNTGDAFFVKGNASTLAQTQCSRCLSDVDLELKCYIEAYYLHKKPDNYTDEEMLEFELLPQDHKVNLGKLISMTMLADAPTKILCSKDCMGLCPDCGCNLNEESCSCNKLNNQDDSPFAVLKDLKID